MDFISVNSRYGVIQVLDTDDLISNFLRLYGEWAWPEVEFISRFVTPSSRVYDAGAFLGTFSLGLGSRIETAELIVVEANPDILPALQFNLQTHCKNRFTVINTALGSRTGDKAHAIYRIENNYGSLSVQESAANGPENPIEPSGIEISSMTLQELRQQHGSFDLLKLDVEGAEPDVLQSDRDWLAANKPVVWCECNESVVSLKTLSLLLECGYHTVYFAFPSFNVRNFNAETKRIFECAYEAGILALPEQIDIRLDDLLTENQCLLRKVDSIDTLREAIWHTPRWGRAAWNSLSRPELIALLGRTINRNAFTDFLKI